MHFTNGLRRRIQSCDLTTNDARSFPPLALACLPIFWSVILLLLSSSRAYGEWAMIDKNEQRGMTLYVDTETINRRSDSDMVDMWSLEDFTTSQTTRGTTYLSRKVQSTYYCTKPMKRTLWVKEFSGNMGSGEVVYTFSYLFSTEHKWVPVLPGSPIEALWRLACDKK